MAGMGRQLAEQDRDSVCQSDVEDGQSGAKASGMHAVFGPSVKRHKYDPSGETPFEVKDLKCLTGRHLKEPVVLPTCEIDGTILVRFGYREAWASSVCGGRVHGGRLMDRAQKAVRDDITKAITAAAKKKVLDDTSKAAQCRSALDLDDTDSDAEVDGKEDEADSPDITGVQEIYYNGLSFKAAKKRKQIFVEGTTQVLETMCSACLDAAAALVEKNTALEVARPKADHSARDSGTMSEPKDKRIQWMSGSRAFQVTYQGSDGKTYRSIKGLKVNACDRSRKPLDQEAYRNAFNAVFEKAKQTWNTLDESGRERF